MAAVGFVFWPDMEHLPRILPILEEVDYVEVAPETLWQLHGAPNAYYKIVADLADGGLPIVAHGVALDPASADAPRRHRWLERLRRDTRRLGLRWVSDHLGTVFVDGEPVALPLPAPASFERLRLCLDQLSEATGAPAAIENSAWYAYPGAALDEAAQLREALGDTHHLVLDLHNLYTNAVNLDFDPMVWLERAPLDRVIEIHVSGGSWAPEAWTAGRRIRLDSHDGAVPEQVWALLDVAVPRCTGLRGATLERIEGPVEPHQIDRMLSEILRLKRVVGAHGLDLPAAPSPADGPVPEPHLPPPSQAERQADATLSSLVRDPPADRPGLTTAHHLVIKLRFSRLIRGEPSAQAWFEADPAGFVHEFRRFHRSCPCAQTPWDEAALWRAFRGTSVTQG